MSDFRNSDLLTWTISEVGDSEAKKCCNRISGIENLPSRLFKPGVKPKFVPIPNAF